MARALAVKPQPAETRRTRASQPAIRAALQAIKDSGLPVERVCVIGGQVEIHCGHIEAKALAEKDDGLEEW